MRAARMVAVSVMMMAVATVSGCVVIDTYPPEHFDARLTYDGDRTTATIAFPEYSHGAEAVSVPGIVAGTAPITSARIEHDEERRYLLDIARKPDDGAGGGSGTGAGAIQCILTVDDIGHATACSGSTKSCSIVLEVRP